MRNTKFSDSGHKTFDNLWKNKEDDGAGELGLEPRTKEKHKLDEKVHRLQMYGWTLTLCGIPKFPGRQSSLQQSQGPSG